jgi:hypothetical protein
LNAKKRLATEKKFIGAPAVFSDMATDGVVPHVVPATRVALRQDKDDAPEAPIMLFAILLRDPSKY